MTGVLVSYGSKMGGTAGLADGIAARLRERGLSVDLFSADEVDGVDGYEALVVGSAIYMNKWRPEAVRLLVKVAATTSDTPLWLFHSGPLGDEAQDPQNLPKRVRDLTTRLNVQDSVTFGGRLPEKPKGLLARGMAKSNAGDWRDFGDVGLWADKIADALLISGQVT
jgi:menaquinone-dependent protoporphyrinogen oxidase